MMATKIRVVALPAAPILVLDMIVLFTLGGSWSHSSRQHHYWRLFSSSYSGCSSSFSCLYCLYGMLFTCISRPRTRLDSLSLQGLAHCRLFSRYRWGGIGRGQYCSSFYHRFSYGRRGQRRFCCGRSNPDPLATIETCALLHIE